MIYRHQSPQHNAMCKVLTCFTEILHFWSFLVIIFTLKMSHSWIKYWWGQMHCGPPTKILNLAHPAAPPCFRSFLRFTRIIICTFRITLLGFYLTWGSVSHPTFLEHMYDVEVNKKCQFRVSHLLMSVFMIQCYSTLRSTDTLYLCLSGMCSRSACSRPRLKAKISTWPWSCLLYTSDAADE